MSELRKAVILLNELPENAGPDELDVLDQACAVEEAFDELGISSQRVFMNPDLKTCLSAITNASPDVVFNLVESVAGRADLIHIAPALLKTTGIPFTGCGPESMFVTSNKLLTKKMLKAAAIPTPSWFDSRSSHSIPDGLTCIIKPLWEDASVGINDSSVFSAPGDALIQTV